ncbi:hypothetical protein [Caballeronia pedi]|uniref:hypothetical protein n=1 Tax=Caballeronia pedi TaxID=1777141 RepID=UPI0011782C01|nr:hypothetical protein [Caballeronia pedi]
MNLIEHGRPSNSGGTGTPVDPGKKASGDELQRHSMIPRSATGCRRAAGALSLLHCFNAFACCHLRVIDCLQRSLSRRKIFRALNVQFNQAVEIAGLETTLGHILRFVHCTNITVKSPFLPNKTNLYDFPAVASNSA